MTQIEWAVIAEESLPHRQTTISAWDTGAGAVVIWFRAYLLHNRSTDGLIASNHKEGTWTLVDNFEVVQNARLTGKSPEVTLERLE